ARRQALLPKAACRPMPATRAGTRPAQGQERVSRADDRRGLVDAVREILSRIEADQVVLPRIAQDAEGIASLLYGLDRIAHDLSQGDDPLVGAAEIFAAAVGDESLTFLGDAILLGRGDATPPVLDLVIGHALAGLVAAGLQRIGPLRLDLRRQEEGGGQMVVGWHPQIEIVARLVP